MVYHYYIACTKHSPSCINVSTVVAIDGGSQFHIPVETNAVIGNSHGHRCCLATRRCLKQKVEQEGQQVHQNIVWKTNEKFAFA